EEDVFLMEQVVVTSDRNEINRKEAPVIVNVISPKTFEQKQSNSLIDGLDFTSGVRTECNCQNCGFSQVRMNGLDGPYSQILINSRPVFSGLAGVYGLELFPANMIQRVEVVRGGGSALFGGNAIAGTINVITREPVSNTFGIGGNISSIGIGHHEGGSPATDRSLKFNGSLVSKDNKSGMFLYGFNRDRDPFDENNDGFTEMVKMTNSSIGFNSYYKPGKLSKLNLDFYKLKESRRGGNKLEMLPHETDITEMVDHDITGGGLSFDSFTTSGNKISLYAAAQHIDRDSYYGALQDETAYGKTY
ncbi:MAG: TonB-dependent receptor plug domain-containing protein, partial [Bacteroidales bacterium]|nr:TonB-dependent receptor plug domain-containing protein [Bacteroidales bacterium]